MGDEKFEFAPRKYRVMVEHDGEFKPLGYIDELPEFEGHPSKLALVTRIVPYLISTVCLIGGICYGNWLITIAAAALIAVRAFYEAKGRI